MFASLSTPAAWYEDRFGSEDSFGYRPHSVEKRALPRIFELDTPLHLCLHGKIIFFTSNFLRLGKIRVELSLTKRVELRY